MVHNLSPGGGKSLLAISEALMSGKRAVVLTMTKPLQTQYSEQWREAGILEVKGQSNYTCNATLEGGEHYISGTPSITVDDGPCHYGQQCSLKFSGCTYYDRLRATQYRNLSVLNYDVWLMTNRFSDYRIGKVPLLILDEAALVPEKLARAMSVEISESDIRGTLKFKGKLSDISDAAAWADWASGYRIFISNLLDAAKRCNNTSRAAKLNRIKREIDGLSQMDEDWIGEAREGIYYFEPIWPQRYAERYLFAGAEKVVMYSATIRPKTVGLLGVDFELVDYFEHQSPISSTRRPIYYIPVGKLNYKSDPSVIKSIFRKSDQVAAQRLHISKGLVHTGSYARQRDYVEVSSIKDYLLSPGSEELSSTLAVFKSLPPPAVLASPAIHTGYDFAGDMAHWQTIFKIRFPDKRPAIMAARCSSDSSYEGYLATQDLEQTWGRIVREVDDYGETFLFDESFEFCYQNRGLLSSSFWQAVVKRDTIPPPLRFD